jgi:hypothetical protein
MGPYTFAEIDGTNHPSVCEVNDPQEAAVRARLANSSVTVDRYEGLLPIGRRRHFMTSDAILRDRCDLPACCWSNDPERLISLVGDQEQATPDVVTWLCGIQGGTCAAEVERQKEDHHRQIRAEFHCVHGRYR